MAAAPNPPELFKYLIALIPHQSQSMMTLIRDWKGGTGLRTADWRKWKASQQRTKPNWFSSQIINNEKIKYILPTNTCVNYVICFSG